MGSRKNEPGQEEKPRVSYGAGSVGSCDLIQLGILRNCGESTSDGLPKAQRQECCVVHHMTFPRWLCSPSSKFVPECLIGSHSVHMHEWQKILE